MPRRAEITPRPVQLDPLHGSRLVTQIVNKVMLDGKKSLAEQVVYESELLYFGPAGAGGATGSVVPLLGVTPAYLPRSEVRIETELLVS